MKALPNLIFGALILCSLLTGLGGSLAYTASVNSTAKTFPDTAVSESGRDTCWVFIPCLSADQPRAWLFLVTDCQHLFFQAPLIYFLLVIHQLSSFSLSWGPPYQWSWEFFSFVQFHCRFKKILIQKALSLSLRNHMTAVTRRCWNMISQKVYVQTLRIVLEQITGILVNLTWWRMFNHEMVQIFRHNHLLKQWYLTKNLTSMVKNCGSVVISGYFLPFFQYVGRPSPLIL